MIIEAVLKYHKSAQINADIVTIKFQVLKFFILRVASYCLKNPICEFSNFCVNAGRITRRTAKPPRSDPHYGVGPCKSKNQPHCTIKHLIYKLTHSAYDVSLHSKIFSTNVHKTFLLTSSVYKVILWDCMTTRITSSYFFRAWPSTLLLLLVGYSPLTWHTRGPPLSPWHVSARPSRYPAQNIFLDSLWLYRLWHSACCLMGNKADISTFGVPEQHTDSFRQFRSLVRYTLNENNNNND